MTETILLALWIATTLFFIIRDMRTKEDRESHERWISDLRDCIHSIERHFSRDCERIITDAFSGRNIKGEIIIDDYRREITELKEEYINNLHEKIVARKGKYSIKTVPEHLANEYEKNISDIAETYRYFGAFMAEQIKDLTKGDYHWNKIY